MTATATALAPVTPPHDTDGGERVAPPPNLRALALTKEDDR